jgi:hypothetical protein
MTVKKPLTSGPIPPKPLRNAVYLWLHVTLAYLPYAVNVGDLSSTNIDQNIANVKGLLSAAAVTIDANTLRAIVTNLLDPTNFGTLSDTKALLLTVPPFNGGWSGTDVHPTTGELDSIFIAP